MPFQKSWFDEKTAFDLKNEAARNNCDITVTSSDITYESLFPSRSISCINKSINQLVIPFSIIEHLMLTFSLFSLVQMWRNVTSCFLFQR
jgi:hypothetical protein